jgi:hypothetical protein
MKKRFEVVHDDGFIEMETDSFSSAVKYAATCKWNVFDSEHMCIVYDGYNDELLL